MLGGLGQGSEMHKTVQKQRRDSVKRSLKESSGSTLSGNNEGGLKFKEATPEQLQEIREKMQKEKERNRMISIILFGVLLTVVLYVKLQPVF